MSRLPSNHTLVSNLSDWSGNSFNVFFLADLKGMILTAGERKWDVPQLGVLAETSILVFDVEMPSVYLDIGWSCCTQILVF